RGAQRDEPVLPPHQPRPARRVPPPPRPPAPPADVLALPREVLVSGGPFTMGTSDDPWALDNERPAHTVHVPGFFIDTTPVTCGEYAEFIAAGGYDDPRWWSGRGWPHRQEAGLQ